MTTSVILRVKETSLTAHVQKSSLGGHKKEGLLFHNRHCASPSDPLPWNPSRLKDAHAYGEDPGQGQLWEMKQDDWLGRTRARRNCLIEVTDR